MKIVVIGGSRYLRARTVKKLQRKGHEVETAASLPRVDNYIADHRDAGYAGQTLRRLLLHLASLVHELWRQRRIWRSKLCIRVERHDPKAM
ncbi:hypothetical protein FJ945_15855 [Mesorhizobium sp. B2-4-9]|uniref:hypothetical protein n=1 Tax=Mesorhizobium sp. B2-4-9 TaxID=2589940 RepID=UPI00112C6348|nr:hypothetical protein [Mesorhizobium sp. B2-4-9]TPL23384.1 hypothetical protein FJ945_15855 [Mesorhizobium sp. B2-4-9]